MTRTAGQRLVERLAAFAQAINDGEASLERLTSRTLQLSLVPQAHSPDLVKATRDCLGISQALFAQFLGVSVRTVSAWERGAKAPQDIACRFMDEIRRDPEYWRNRLRESIVRKPPVSPSAVPS